MFKLSKLYAIANLSFAATNAIISVLIAKFFGLRFYGFISYFNSLDTFFDYIGGHTRSTFEYSSATSSNDLNVINSFAVLQLILGLISSIVFGILTFFQQDSKAVYICLSFIFLSPGKAYLNFFRILSKVTGSLKWFTIIVLLLSILNVFSVFFTFFFFGYKEYLILRSLFLVSCVLFLALTYSLNFGNFLTKCLFSINELRYKSRAILGYSFVTLFSIVFDKLVIKFFFGAEALGSFSLAFLAYNMFLIFGGSLIGGYFNILTRKKIGDYIRILTNSIFSVVILIVLVEILILVSFNFSYLQTFQVSLPFIIWFLPTSLISLVVQIAYIYMISSKRLSLFNWFYFYISLSYLIISSILSLFFRETIWFAQLFFLHQLLIVFFLGYKFNFIKVVLLKSLNRMKFILLFFIVFHLIFSEFNNLGIQYNLF